MKKLSFILVFFAAGNLFAQNQRPKDIKDAPQIKERIANNGQKAKPEVTVSHYHGFDSQISSMMPENKIPADCPNGLQYPDRKKFVGAVNKWLLENQDKVSAEKKNSLITE